VVDHSDASRGPTNYVRRITKGLIAETTEGPLIREMGYPTAEEIREMFKLQETGEVAKFFDLYISDDVLRTVELHF
jgi:hypothetical protein